MQAETEQPKVRTNAEIKTDLIRRIHRISNTAYSTKKLLMIEDAVKRVEGYKR